MAAAIGTVIGTGAQPVADQRLPAVARRQVVAPISRGAVPRVVDLILRGVVRRGVALGLIAAARQAVGQISPAMIAVVREISDQWVSVQWGVVPISRDATLVPSVAIVLPVVAVASATAAVNRISPVGLISSKVK